MIDAGPWWEWARDAVTRSAWGQAASALRTVLTVDPGDARSLYNLGLVEQRRYADDTSRPAAFYRRALAVEPANASAAGRLVDLRLKAGDVDEASRLARSLSRRRPLDPVAWRNAATVAVAAGARGDALASLRRGLVAEPGHGASWLLRGQITHVAVDDAEAGPASDGETSYRRARICDHRDPLSRANLGAVLHEIGRVDEAISCYREALSLAPDDLSTWANLAAAAIDAGDTALGRSAVAEGLARDPNDARVRWIERWIALLKRDFERGFRDFDMPWRPPIDPGLPAHAAAFPLWEGEPLGEGRLLLWCEHGVGDEILYAGLARRLVSIGIDVVLEADRRLVSLFSRSLTGVRVIARGDPLPDGIVAQSSSLRLPMLGWRRDGALRVQDPWMSPDTARMLAFRDRFYDGRPLVGLCWRSGNRRTGARKSTPLSAWAPLLESKAIRTISLQYGEVEETHPGLILPEGLDLKADIDGVASLIAAMDHVVTIAGVSAHLAGALGTLADVLVPPAPLWFWFGSGEACTWYPTLRLHRRARDGGWHRAMDEVTDRLTR